MKLLIRHLEEVSVRVWPALETALDDGWLLRYNGGYTRRANSVLPVYGSSRNIRHKIADCEAFYRQRDLPTVFKLTPAVYPRDLDGVLAAQGYLRSEPVSVQTCDLPYYRLAPDSRVTVRQWPAADWLEAHAELNGISPTDRFTLRRMLGRGLAADGYYANIWLDGRVVASGMAQRDDDHVGLFGIATDPAYRRQGLARAVVITLMAYAQADGAQIAFLQVNQANMAARRLYAELGFCETYRYWYRSRTLV